MTRIHKSHWLYEVGVDALYADHPINRLQDTPSQPLSSAPSSAPVTKGPVDDLSHITSLEDLQKAVENFDGCALKKTAMHTVFADGNPKASVMLIGEAPGADEDRQGKPFVGMSGQLLTKIFETAGFSRDRDLYITNVIPWRPAGNRQPTSYEIRLCLPFLLRHIELVRPKVIVLVGGTAVKAVIGEHEGITKLRGTWRSFQTPHFTTPAQLTATYHPAYLLRSPSRKRDVWVDVLTIKEWLRTHAP